MTWQEYKFLITSDLYRHTGKISWAIWIKNILINPGFKYSFMLRTCAYLVQHKVLRYTLFPFALLWLWHYKYKFGIDIPFRTQIGSGFYIGHFGGIVVNADAVIGKNCNLSQGVTIGVSNRGTRKGNPVIGNNVFIGPGAKIIGRVLVSDDSAIGANCVVTKDVPERAVVVGNPARIVSYEGSEGYIENVDYEPQAVLPEENLDDYLKTNGRNAASSPVAAEEPMYSKAPMSGI